MQRLQGWVRYAAEGLSQRAGNFQQQQTQDSEDEEDFIYARVQVHSDDEDVGPARRTSSRRPVASDLQGKSAAADTTSRQQEAQRQTQHAHPPSGQLLHWHSHSDGDLLRLDSVDSQQSGHLRQHQVEGIDDLLHERNNNVSNDSNKIQKLASTGPGWEAEWTHQVESNSSSANHQPTRPSATNGASVALSSTSAQQQQHQERIDSNSRASTSAADSGIASISAEVPNQSDPQATAVDDEDDQSGEIPDHEHSYAKRELIIYAIPLVHGKVIFLPVCPWRNEPEQHKGIKKAIAGHVGKVQGEASDLWQRMAAAEQGTFVNRVYKLGKRVLDSISPEERLMRGVPKNISRVVIHHPTQISPEMIMEQMQTMTKSYGIKAVGKAAAATLMLPLALGVDLIILPGPQVLTYYTMWELYRNTNGALGTTRMTKFITQGGSSDNIRVCYVQEARLDRYHDIANDCPEGVLPEDEIENLVADLREPDLAEALLSLRNKALRESGKRTSKGGDEYVALPPSDPGLVTGLGSGQVDGSGHSSRRVSAGW